MKSNYLCIGSVFQLYLNDVEMFFKEIHMYVCVCVCVRVRACVEIEEWKHILSLSLDLVKVEWLWFYPSMWKPPEVTSFLSGS